MVISIIYALHIYHTVYYCRKLSLDDMLHHVSALCVCVPLAIYYSPGSLLGYSFFFTTGLPGMINYLLLWRERNGNFPRQCQKKWNVRLNVWIRNPGCISCATLIFLKTFFHPENTIYHKIAGLVVSLLTVWNGSYFMEQVVSDYAKRYLHV